MSKVWEETGIWDDANPDLKEKWDAKGTYYEMDFLSAATSFLGMPIEDALHSENYIIRIFAILDRRVGTRTLRKIKEQGDYRSGGDFWKINVRSRWLAGFGCEICRCYNIVSKCMA